MSGSLVYYYNLFPFLHFELCFFQHIMDFFGVSKVSSSIQKAKHSCSHKRIVQLTAPLNQNEMLPMYPYRRWYTVMPITITTGSCSCPFQRLLRSFKQVL